MNGFIVKTVFGVLVLVGVGCQVEQPKQRCSSAPGAFALKYTRVDGTGACADLKGEVAGVNAYWRMGVGGTPTVTRGGVAIKTDEVGALLEEYGQEADTKELAAFGSFATDEPGEDGFCDVTMAKPSTLKLTAVPPRPTPSGGMSEALPPVELTMDWSQVRFYVTAAQPGTLFTGRLKYTKVTDGQSCNATYDVTGIWPLVECEGESPGKPDEDTCHPCADPEAGRRTGSGISPGIDVTCDPGTLTCVPRRSVPSLREQPLLCKA